MGQPAGSRMAVGGFRDKGFFSVTTKDGDFGRRFRLWLKVFFWLEGDL